MVDSSCSNLGLLSLYDGVFDFVLTENIRIILFFIIDENITS